LEAFQRLFCRHPEVRSELAGRTKGRISEPGIPFGPIPTSRIEIVADCPYKTVGIAGNAFQSLAQETIRRSETINISRNEGSDSLLPGQSDHADPTILIEGFTKVHEPRFT
jgi:hypothetical protein